MNLTASALLNRLLAKGKFRHIQVLLNLVELGSVQKTAQAIGMSQSAVTQALATMEELVGDALFDRHARGVTPNTLCRDLLPAARQLMGGLTEGADIVTARRHQGLGTVRLMASAAAINGMLHDALPAFAQQHPQLSVLLNEAERPEQLRAIAEGSVDIVVCRAQAVVPEGWQFEVLCGDALIVVCHPSHPLARRKRVQPQDLASQTWLLTPTGTAARTQFDEFAAWFSDTPMTHCVVTRSMSMIHRLLREPGLLALLPRALVGAQLESGELLAIALPLQMSLQPIGMLTPRHAMAAAAQTLAQYLRTAAVGP